VNITTVDVAASSAAAQPTATRTGFDQPVRDPLAWAVLAAIFCFAPTGVVAVVHAARVKPLLAAGQVAAARRAAKVARRYCWVSLAVTACFVLVVYLGADGYSSVH
jgi:hypothetical protein